MGKASRRKQQQRKNKDVYAHPIQVLSQETGEVIESFVNPKVAKHFNDMVLNGATQEDINKFVTDGVSQMLDERKKNAPLDGQRRKPCDHD